MKTQLEIEAENFEISTAKALKEYHTAVHKGDLANLKGSAQVLQHYKGILADELIQATEDAKEGTAKPKRVANQLIMVLGAEVIAHYAISAVIEGNTTKSKRGFYTLASLVGKLSKTLRKEFRLHEAKAADKDRFKFMTSMLKKRTYSHGRKLDIANELIIKYQNFTKLERDKKFDALALYALEYLAAIKPVIRGHQFDAIFGIELIQDGKKQYKAVSFNNWFREYLKNNILNGNLVPALNTPLVEKPIPWKSFRGGGFHSNDFKFNLISKGKASDYTEEELKPIIDTVNRLQNTGLRINKKIQALIQMSVDLDLGLGGLPRNEEINLLPYPFQGKKYADLDEDQQKIFREFMVNRKAEYTRKVAIDSNYMTMIRVVADAKRFKDYPAIYFTYYADYRGRIYNKTNALNPQGANYNKALLEFAEGKAIDNRDAEMFLAGQGANTFGEDKKSFIDKHLWVLMNHEAILSCAKNPLDSEAMWHQADDPWNFLAFCFEWAAYSEQGTSFKSHLNIAMDCSANGLQHLSAMFLDEVGGKPVNLTANEVKGDMYTDVQHKTIELLNNRGTDIGLKLVEIGAITRKACKKPVMTVPYAGTKMGTRDSVRDYLEDNMLLKHFSTEDRTQVIGEYTNALWDAIELTILKGREVMYFLKKAAPLIIKASTNNFIEWHTPNGFRVVQRKPKTQQTKANTTLGDFCGQKRAYVNMSYRLIQQNTRKHGSSIAPNFVHSLDSCHLQNTVLSLPEALSFNMVHDSYGTHAKDSRAMYQAIRQQFYDIYKNNDILDKFIKEQPEFDLPELPTNGKLDLTEVLKSEYFCA